MNIEPFQTNDSTVKQAAKVMLVGHQGSGKTTAIADFYETYGAGLVLSGESGLSSISHLPIDYLPFGSFDRPNKAGKYTFMDLVKYVSSDAFKAKGYKWIALDSATELSQRCFADVEKEFEGSANGFEKWGAYERKITAALKWIRDLDTNVLITCLAAEENDDNGVTQYWPMLVQKKVQKLAPALYDHVFCLVRKTQEEEGRLKVTRHLITDNVHGWHGKSRDPHRRLKPVENTDKVTDLLARIYMTEDEFKTTQKEGVSK